MKKFAAVLVLCILVVGCSGCVVVEDVEEVPVSESLKISTWVLDEKYENNGYWESDTYDAFDKGRWICDDGTVIENGGDVFSDEVLELNKPRITAPLNYGGYNLNIHIESDDVINVTADVIGNCDIVLAYSPSSPDNVIVKDWSVSNDITALGSFTVNVFPIGKIIPAAARNGKLIYSVTLADREYYIDIKTYTLDGRPRVTAQLKLTAIEDDNIPELDTKDGIYSIDENLTRRFEIELVKFGYSDTALHDEFERYDHLYN